MCLAGVEFMHMIREGQFASDGAAVMSFVDQTQWHRSAGLPAPCAHLHCDYPINRVADLLPWNVADQLRRPPV